MSKSTNEPDYLQFYNLESHLFETINPRFHEQGNLSTCDFFCIIVWKANRAKTLTAGMLREYGELDETVRALTTELYQQKTDRDRLRCLLVNWGFALPMASAILAVLYPDDFTIYDSRVCRMLGGNHERLANKNRFDDVWDGYLQFKQGVINLAPAHLSLRDKDRYLWGKSFYEQLCADAEDGFAKRD